MALPGGSRQDAAADARHTVDMRRSLPDAMAELELELAGERAGALGRIAARMERALAELRAFDETRDGVDTDAAAREELAAAAAESVWFYVVQRESLGLYRHDEALRFYAVPPEVKRRIGPRRRSRAAAPIRGRGAFGTR